MTSRKQREYQKNWQKNQPPEWYVWRGMKERCTYPKHPKYYLYGGKGVGVCERWRIPYKGFRSFLADVGQRPGDDYDLHRIDSAKDYEPGNTEWTQANGHRSRHAWAKNNGPSESYVPDEIAEADKALQETEPSGPIYSHEDPTEHTESTTPNRAEG